MMQIIKLKMITKMNNQLFQLIILIIIGIRLLGILDKTDGICDNVEDKVNSLNGAISLVNKTASSISSLSDSIFMGITSTITKFIKKKKEDKKYE